MADFKLEMVFDNADEFLGALTPWSANSDLERYIFRGHSSDQYQLVPSALRLEAKEKFWETSRMGKPYEDQSEEEAWQIAAEYNLLRNFYRLADRKGLYVPHSERVRQQMLNSTDSLFSDFCTSTVTWLSQELLELAGLAQHYGLPTRLLDWSHDPLTAAYFAAASAKPDTNISVWALDADTYAYWNTTSLSSPLKFVTPPYHGNPNLSAQVGLFTNWSVTVGPDRLQNPQFVDRTPLDVLMKAHAQQIGQTFSRSALLQFKLPSEHAPTVKALLRSGGYGPARIFPGYAGVAKEVSGIDLD